MGGGEIILIMLIGVVVVAIGVCCSRNGRRGGGGGGELSTVRVEGGENTKKRVNLVVDYFNVVLSLSPSALVFPIPPNDHKEYYIYYVLKEEEGKESERWVRFAKRMEKRMGPRAHVCVVIGSGPNKEIDDLVCIAYYKRLEKEKEERSETWLITMDKYRNHYYHPPPPQVAEVREIYSSGEVKIRKVELPVPFSLGEIARQIELNMKRLRV